MAFVAASFTYSRSGSLKSGWAQFSMIAWARWRGRPDPGPVDTARMLPVGQGVFVALVIMALVLIWVDIVAPF